MGINHGWVCVVDINSQVYYLATPGDREGAQNASDVENVSMAWRQTWFHIVLLKNLEFTAKYIQ